MIDIGSSTGSLSNKGLALSTGANVRGRGEDNDHFTLVERLMSSIALTQSSWLPGARECANSSRRFRRMYSRRSRVTFAVGQKAHCELFGIRGIWLDPGP